MRAGNGRKNEKESRGSNCSALRRNFNLPPTLHCNVSLIAGLATDLRGSFGGWKQCGKSWRAETQARTFKPSTSPWKLACRAYPRPQPPIPPPASRRQFPTETRPHPRPRKLSPRHSPDRAIFAHLGERRKIRYDQGLIVHSHRPR